MRGRTLFFVVVVALSGCVDQSEKSGNLAWRYDKNPKAAEINVQLGLGYLAQGNTDRAKEKLLLALAQDTQSTKTNGALAFFYEKTGDAPGAERYYKRALFYEPNDGGSLNNYGTFLCHQRRFQEADRYFKLAVADRNYLESSGAYENAAICAQADKRPQDATRYFELALAQTPNRLVSMMELARLYHRQDRNPDALKLIARYETLAAINPDLALLGYEVSRELKNTKQMDHFQVLLQTRFASTPQYANFNEMRKA